MRAADGLIVSTEFLARRYRALNGNVWVCRNGLDLGRYDFTPPRGGETVTIGWAGGTGHREAMVPWLNAVGRVMEQRPHVRFMSVGEQFASVLEPQFGPRASDLGPVHRARLLPGGDGELRHRAGPGRRRRTSTAPRATCAGSRRAPWAYPRSPTRSSTTRSRTASPASTRRPSRRPSSCFCAWSTTPRSALHVGAAAREHLLAHSNDRQAGSAVGDRPRRGRRVARAAGGELTWRPPP